MVAIATHCNLRPSDVAPVVLGFNYKAQRTNSTILLHPRTHNAPTRQISAKSDNPRQTATDRLSEFKLGTGAKIKAEK